MLITLLVGIFLNMAHANVDLGAGVRVSQTQIQTLQQRFSKLDASKRVYHWTSFETGLRWHAQGRLDGGEVAFYNRPTGVLQVYGPGLYFSENSIDSQSFGSVRIEFEIPRGTFLYDDTIIRQVIGTDLTQEQIAKLGEVIPFIRKVTGSWFVGNHVNHFQTVRLGNVAGETMLNWDKGLRSYDLELALKEAGAREGKLLHLESLLHLSIYMDGISFYRALKVNPLNPWAEFEPQNFERFRSTRQELLTKQKSSTKLGIVYDANKNKIEWVTKQVESILPQIHQKVSGDRDGSPWRTEGIRAGGDRDGRTFLVTTEQLEILRANPYLTVELKSSVGNGHLVAYHYPDVFHADKIMDRLSPQTRQRLQATPKDRLWQDTALRQTLNRQIIKDLLAESLARNATQAHNNQFQNIGVLRDLISIHPFGDFNGRSLRLYYEMGYAEKGLELPYSFLNDLDILTSEKKYAELLREGSLARKKLIESFMAELSLAMKENRNPQYHQVEGLNKFFEALKPIGGRAMSRELTFSELEMIRRRDFQSLFGEIIRLNIGTANCRAVFL
jgi:hypothetical protein